MGDEVNHWDYADGGTDDIDRISGYFPGEFTATVIPDGEQVVASTVLYSDGYYFFAFLFAEHDGSKLNHVYDFSVDDTLSFYVKDNAGKEYRFKAYSEEELYGIYVADDLNAGFIELMKDNEELKCMLKVSNSKSGASETFSFSLNNKDFSQLMDTLIAKYSFSEEAVINQLNVVEEYDYSDSYGFSHSAFVIVENASTFTIELGAKIKFYDKDGSLVGYSSDSVHAVGPNERICLSFSNSESYDHYEIIWSASEERYYKAICSNISLEVSKAKNKAIIEATNKGDSAAQFVEYYALFFNGNKVVGYGWGYLTDNDSEIKAGKSELREATCYSSFDSVKVYISGRAAK
jgi:hypothetical protein